jgi:UDP-N-acetylglucosamine 2-epimerase (non-hydrolysing)
MKIMSVVGARPNFMKLAPIISAIREHNSRTPRDPHGAGAVEECLRLEHVLVHTGQHYDEEMSGSFFKDLNLPDPDVYLGVGSGSHGVQTAEIMKRFEEVLLRERPDIVVVVGDVNSTLACSLVAAKTVFDAAGTRSLIAHVEAGLRSFDRTMPEEVNRVVTDHVSDLLFVTEESGLRNLRQEGIAPEKVHFVGNTMIDSVFAYQQKAESSTVLDRLGLRNAASHNGTRKDVARYALLTLHRPSNVDSRAPLLNILEGLQELSARMPIIFPAHPRTRKRVDEFGLGDYFVSSASAPVVASGIRMVEPQGYLDFLCMMKHASLVVTDSGGVQEETTCLGIPCVTVRENTERPITVKIGTNIIAGVKADGIRKAVRRQLEARASGAIPEKWDGYAAARIVEIIWNKLQRLQAASEPITSPSISASAPSRA